MLITFTKQYNAPDAFFYDLRYDEAIAEDEWFDVGMFDEYDDEW